MPERLLLIDTDMLVLLGGSETLSIVLDLLGFRMDQARRLAAATCQLQRGRRFKDAYPAPLLQSAFRTAGMIAPITEPPRDLELADRLARVSAIDPGEAQLFALLAEHPAYYLTSGDKRALTAVGQERELSGLRERIRGRIICLESILKLLVMKSGAAAIGAAFEVLRRHKTLSVLLSATQTKDDQTCLQGIDSYIKDLVTQTGHGFLHLPELPA